MKTHIKPLLIILALCLVIPGCFSHQAEPPKLPHSPAGRLAEATKSTGGLVWMFIVAAAISAMALFNGSKSAAGWIAASLFGLGLSIAVARYAELIGLICLVGSTVWFFRSTLKRHGWLFNWCIRKEEK